MRYTAAKQSFAGTAGRVMQSDPMAMFKAAPQQKISGLFCYCSSVNRLYIKSLNNLKFQIVQNNLKNKLANMEEK
jgi:hypothetical protein